MHGCILRFHASGHVSAHHASVLVTKRCACSMRNVQGLLVNTNSPESAHNPSSISFGVTHGPRSSFDRGCRGNRCSRYRRTTGIMISGRKALYVVALSIIILGVVTLLAEAQVTIHARLLRRVARSTSTSMLAHLANCHSDLQALCCCTIR
jgi:hypothetical protein